MSFNFVAAVKVLEPKKIKSATVLEPKKIKSATVSTFPSFVCHDVVGSDTMNIEYIFVNSSLNVL